MRGSHKELRKFMRDVKRVNPTTACNLQYDKLWVGNRCYRFDMEEGRVVGMEVCCKLFGFDKFILGYLCRMEK